MEVHIDELDEGEVAQWLRGHVQLGAHAFPFEAIAYGRIGGQNVVPQLSAETIRRLQELAIDPSRFEERLQLKLVHGEIILHAPPENPDAADELKHEGPDGGSD